MPRANADGKIRKSPGMQEREDLLKRTGNHGSVIHAVQRTDENVLKDGTFGRAFANRQECEIRVCVCCRTQQQKQPDRGPARRG
jgi:hypothetical protein